MNIYDLVVFISLVGIIFALRLLLNNKNNLKIYFIVLFYVVSMSSFFYSISASLAYTWR